MSACAANAAEIVAAVKSLAGEVAKAGEIAVQALRAYVRDVASGARPMRPQVPNIEVAPSPPPPVVERKQIFLRHNSKWTDAAYGLCTSPAHSTVYVPAAVAQTALAAGVALDPRSEVAQKLYQAFGCTHVILNPEKCCDLASGILPFTGITYSPALVTTGEATRQMSVGLAEPLLSPNLVDVNGGRSR